MSMGIRDAGATPGTGPYSRRKVRGVQRVRKMQPGARGAVGAMDAMGACVQKAGWTPNGGIYVQRCDRRIAAPGAPHCTPRTCRTKTVMYNYPPLVIIMHNR